MNTATSLRALLAATAFIALPAFPRAAQAATAPAGCASAKCAYKCTNAFPTDLKNIQADIDWVNEQSGGIVQLAPGTCDLGDSSVQPYTPIYLTLRSNVWLRGSGSSGAGETLLQRTALFSNATMLFANGAENVSVTDMAIDAGGLHSLFLAGKTIPAGTNTISFPLSLAPNFPLPVPDPSNNPFNRVVLIDMSQPLLVNASSVTPFPNSDSGIILSQKINGDFYPAISKSASQISFPLSQQGNIADGTGVAKTVNAGDILGLFTLSGSVYFNEVSGANFNNLQFLRNGNIMLNSTSNYVISNSSFQTPGPAGAFACLGGIITADWGAMGSNGLIANNQFFQSGIWANNNNTVISGNAISSASSCDAMGGGSGSADDGQGLIYQGNVIQGGPVATTVSVGTSSATLYANHDGIMNPVMQVFNPNSSIIDNVAYNNAAEGIFSGGPNNLIARNALFNHRQSTHDDNGEIVVDAPNNMVSANVACNTAPGATVSNIHNPPCATPPQAQGGGYPAGTISVNACQTGVGACVGGYEISWATQNANGVTVKVAKGKTLGCPLEMAAAPSGASYPNWINQQDIYVFNLKDSAGHVLDSATLVPAGYSTLNQNFTSWPASCN